MVDYYFFNKNPISIKPKMENFKSYFRQKGVHFWQKQIANVFTFDLI